MMWSIPRWLTLLCVAASSVQISAVESDTRDESIDLDDLLPRTVIGRKLEAEARRYGKEAPFDGFKDLTGMMKFRRNLLGIADDEPYSPEEKEGMENILDHVLSHRRRLLGIDTEDKTNHTGVDPERLKEQQEAIKQVRRRLLGHQAANAGESIVWEETTYLPNAYNPGLYPFGFDSFAFGGWDHGFAGPVEDEPELPEYRRVGKKFATEVIFDEGHGLVAVGMLEKLIELTLVAYCKPKFGQVYECPEYEDSRKRLWKSIGAVVCGLDDAGWETMKHFAVEKQLEFTLGQCDQYVSVDIEQMVDLIAGIYLFESGLQRPDLVAIVTDNDRRADRPPTQPDDDIEALHPALYIAIAPIPTGLRTPAVVTYKRPVDFRDHVMGQDTGVPEWADSNVPSVNARLFRGPFPEDGSPVSSNIERFEMHIHRMRDEQINYAAQYLSHPSAYAMWAEKMPSSADIRQQQEEKYYSMRKKWCFSENTCKPPISYFEM